MLRESEEFKRQKCLKALLRWKFLKSNEKFECLELKLKFSVWIEILKKFGQILKNLFKVFWIWRKIFLFFSQFFSLEVFKTSNGFILNFFIQKMKQNLKILSQKYQILTKNKFFWHFSDKMSKNFHFWSQNWLKFSQIHLQFSANSF